MLKQHDTLELRSLKQLKAVSFEMLAFAETGDWDAVLKCDNTRLQILKDASLQNKSLSANTAKTNTNTEGQTARDTLVKTILDLDIKIQEIASKERKEIIDKQIHRKAQKAAQSQYKQTLSTGTG